MTPVLYLAVAAVFASLPMTAWVWRRASLQKMALAISAEAAKRREMHAAEQKRYEDALSATTARIGALEVSLGVVQDETHIRLKRLEDGRTLQRVGA